LEAAACVHESVRENALFYFGCKLELCKLTPKAGNIEPYHPSIKIVGLQSPLPRIRGEPVTITR
jgi:hypothetical protein